MTGQGYAYEPESRVWGSILKQKAERHGDKIFVHFKDEVLTYEQLNARANNLANSYIALGVTKGESVSIMMPNCLEFLYHWFGLAKIGAVDNPINIAYKGDMLRHLITNSASKILVIHELFLEELRFIQADLDGLETVVIYSPRGEEPNKEEMTFDLHSFESLLEGPGHPPSLDEVVKPSDPLQIMYTSGTTGPSKGVVLSHNCEYLYATDLIRFVRLGPHTRAYNCLPLFHLNHRFTVCYTMLMEGAYVMGERFSASGFWDEIRRHEANHFHFLGGMPRMIYNQPPKPNDGQNPATTAWGGPIPLDIGEAFENRFGVKLYLGYYGLTEASGTTWMTAEEADRLKRAGKWAQSLGMGREQKDIFEVKLVDDEDKEVPVGEVGEIACRPTRPYSMMTEYKNNPESTVAAFRNLWFHTGDLGRKDEEGYFHFVDRKKDYIRRRGENISSFEVEKVINSHSAVEDSAAIGVKSDLGEDDIKIVVQLKSGEKLAPEDLVKWCEPRMAYFMVPRYFEFVEELSRTPTGRVEKYKLRREGVSEATWDRGESQRAPRS